MKQSDIRLSPAPGGGGSIEEEQNSNEGDDLSRPSIMPPKGLA